LTSWNTPSLIHSLAALVHGPPDVSRAGRAWFFIISARPFAMNALTTPACAWIASSSESRPPP
jgi:hypothetical protein